MHLYKFCIYTPTFWVIRRNCIHIGSYANLYSYWVYVYTQLILGQTQYEYDLYVYISLFIYIYILGR